MFIVALAAALLSSCSGGTLDGKWGPMKWNTKLNIADIAVPAAGETFTFECNNYSSFWLSAIKDNGHQEELPHDGNALRRFDGGWYTIRIEGNSMTVALGANGDRTQQRRLIVEVTAGDIFSNFQFIQSPQK